MGFFFFGVFSPPLFSGAPGGGPQNKLPNRARAFLPGKKGGGVPSWPLERGGEPWSKKKKQKTKKKLFFAFFFGRVSPLFSSWGFFKGKPHGNVGKLGRSKKKILFSGLFVGGAGPRRSFPPHGAGGKTPGAFFWTERGIFGGGGKTGGGGRGTKFQKKRGWGPPGILVFSLFKGPQGGGAGGGVSRDFRALCLFPNKKRSFHGGGENGGPPPAGEKQFVLGGPLGRGQIRRKRNF